MKKFEVVISKDAEKDLAAIYDYIASADGYAQADAIEDRLMGVILSLERSPARGKVPSEMARIGITEFRELQAAPWRIFYYTRQYLVGVVAVLDGRRNVAELLQLRFL